MRRILSVLAITACVLVGYDAQAQEIEQAHGRRPLLGRPQICPTPCPEVVPPITDPDKKPPVEPPLMPGAFAQGAFAGSPEGAAFNTNMFGDIIGGPRVTRVVQLGSGGPFVTAQVPALGRGGFRIADNENPRPQDRVFFLYNYYNNVDVSPATPGFYRFDAHRETIGIEKTFLNGDASVSLRLPFIQLSGSTLGLDGSQVGDLSVGFKYALINNRETGNVLSTGIVVTVPTGEEQPGFVVNLHSTLLQPYVGFVVNGDRLFIQGYSSIVVPTDATDATLWLNDIGLGYWLRRNPDTFITGIVPTFEVHVLNPLNHQGAQSIPVGIPDWVVLTGGVNFVFGRGTTLGLAVGFPVTGPQPFDVQGVASLNIRF